MTTLYACVHAAELPTQTLLRTHPELRSVPIAILDGKPPQQTVCSMNRPARLAGVVHGMTKLEAESIPQLRLCNRSLESETAARAIFLECVSNFSPRIEDVSVFLVSDHAFACILDIAGTERLFGPPAALAERLRTALHAVGLRASIAVSASFHTARLQAAARSGISVIPADLEAETLAKLPLSMLNLAEADFLTFAIWGIRTLGELAALPRVDLVSRIGERALHFHALA